MTKDSLNINKIYITPAELLLAVTYLMTFTAVSVSDINISDKICFGIIALIPFVKWTRSWFDVLLKEYGILVIWCVLPIVNLLFVDYPVQSLFFTINYILQVAVAVSFTLIFAKYDFDYFRIFKFLYQVSVVCAVIGILQYYFFDAVTNIISVFSEGNYATTWNGMHRVSSLFDNPNIFALNSACSFMMGIIIWIYEQRKVYLVENLFIAYGLFCTGTRSAVIGILFGLFVIFVLSFKPFYQIPRNVRYAFIIICALGGAFILIKLLQGGSRFDLIFQGIQTGDWSLITNKRTDIWANQLAHMPGHWLLGLGNGVSGNLSLENFTTGFGAHSLYIGFLIEMGICGIVLFIAFVVITYRVGLKYLRTSQERLSFLVMLSTMLIMQITEMSLYNMYQFIFWFWLIVSMPYSVKRKTFNSRRYNK